MKAVAQPTLTVANNMPVTGDIHRYYNCDSVAPGPSGANQTWDFTGIDTTSGLDGGYATCVSPLCDSFPGSMLANAIAGGQYTYFKTNASAISIHGIHLTGYIKFTDDEDLLRYPMSYGTNNIFSDTFNANYQAGHDYLRFGKVYDTADGWGLLKLPNGNFANVLRVKRVEVYRDTDLNDMIVVANYIQESYTWYTPNRREFLLQILLPKKVNNFPSGSSKVTYTNQTSTGINDVNNADAGINISPNPAKDRVNIRFDDPAEEQVNISLTDMMGKTLLQTSCAKGMQQSQLNTSAIPAGLYFIQFKTSQGTTVRKVEIL